MAPILALKIDVDTERGTRIGVPNLLALFSELDIPATFLFSLGPDNTGRALKRVFRKGFLKKVSRTSVVSTYGLRTLMNGVLLPGPHIGKKHAAIIRQTKVFGHEVGIHCYDHVKWQDNVHKMSQAQVDAELNKARAVFQTIFAQPAQTAGAAGWQANNKSLAAYDAAGFIYGSDGRGSEPFLPHCDGKTFKTLQIPTTLPTLDELIGRPEYPADSWTQHYLSLIKTNTPNIFTMHAEIEGMKYLTWFKEFLLALQASGVEFKPMISIAKQALTHKVPVCAFEQGEVDGRSGTLAVQGEFISQPEMVEMV